MVNNYNCLGKEQWERGKVWIGFRFAGLEGKFFMKGKPAAPNKSKTLICRLA